MCKRETNPARTSTAFTLIEVLVVVAIIALLIAILLPSLSMARAHAKTVVCGTTLRGFGNGLGLYTFANDEWIPGQNTTGVALRELGIQSDPELLQQSHLPVQPQDWITPLILTDTRPPRIRAERFHLLLDQYQCPESEKLTSLGLPFSPLPDEEQFKEVPSWPAVSYLMPAYFSYWGEKQGQIILSRNRAIPTLAIRAQVAPAFWDVVRVPSYTSRMNQLGSAGRKVFAADGTRYLPESLLLDHDIGAFPNLFGAFQSAGAWWQGSTAYGVKQGTETWGTKTAALGSPSEGRNLSLSYRHPDFAPHDGKALLNRGRMNMLFFDGHVELMNDQDSRRIEHWYPKGAVVNSPSEGMTDVPQGFVIP